MGGLFSPETVGELPPANLRAYCQPEMFLFFTMFFIECDFNRGDLTFSFAFKRKMRSVCDKSK